MSELFKNAKFGDRYILENGMIAVYIERRDFLKDGHLLLVQPDTEINDLDKFCFVYSSNGKIIGYNKPALNIKSRLD